MEEKKLIPPVKVGEKIKAMILGCGHKGNPYFKVKGYFIYVEKTENLKLNLKEMIEFRITKVFPKFAFAQVI